MAVSYLSRPYEANPYINPVDLNLLAKVNQYKQSIFYQNADRMEQDLSQLNNTDIFKDNERNYLKDKVNSLTQGINDMGGLNYFDANVSNTLENYASNIYNDPTVLTAITSTHAIRTYLKNSEAIKNDPKLNKFYDPAREWYDTQFALNPNSIINYKNSELGVGYNGPTAPTPYLGNDFDLVASTVSKLDPNITEGYGPSGNPFFLDKTTNTEVSPERIRALIDGHIDGKVADQLNVHAAYNYYGLTNGTYSKEQGLSEYTQYAQSLVDQTNKRIDVLKEDAKDPDNQKRAQAEQELNQLQTQYLPLYTKALKEGNSEFSKLWDQSPQAAMYTLYKNKLIGDVTSAYSYTQQKHQLIVDQQAVYNGKLQLEALKKGKKLVLGPDGTATFQDYGVPQDQTDLTNLTVNKDAEAKLEAQKVSQESLNNDIAKIRQEQSNSLLDLITTTAKVGNIKGLVDNNTTTINNDPTADPISHPELLRNIANLTGDSNLTPQDIDAALAANKNLNTVFGINSLTPDQVTFFQKIKQVMTDGANGKDISGLIPNASNWKKYLQQYTIQQNAIKNKESLIKNAYNQVLSESGSNLTSAEQNALNQYMKNPEAFYKRGTSTTTSPTTGISTPINTYDFIGGPVMQSALNKSGGPDNVNKKVDALLNNTATRKNYYNILLPDDPNILGKMHNDIINYMSQEISKNEAGNSILEIKKKDDISPEAFVTDGDNYFISYTDKSDLTKGTGYIKIEPQDLKALNIPQLPYPQLEAVVAQHGQLYDPLFIDPTATGNKFNLQNNFTAPVRIDIHKMIRSGSSINASNYEASVVIGDGANRKDYFIPGSNNGTANGALQIATNFIQQNTTYKSLQDLLADLQVVNNN